ncbi:hypothetical protein [Clostridium tetani]|uniref:hypothetical protein n=1 Tax=Clostridium tetani TaxID=1513 RepID=UPI0038B3B8A6
MNGKIINKYRIDKYNQEKLLQEENERRKTEQYLIENCIPAETMIINCKRSSLIKTINNNELYVWLVEHKLCFAGKHYSMKINRIDIPKNNITSFLRQGDVYNELKISGGKVEGGGSSIGGAIIGGAIAGEAGAVIGSRKEIKAEEIKSENVRVDKRETILEFINNDKYEYLFFDSLAYDILIKLIPDKEIQFVNQRNSDRDSKIEKNTNKSHNMIYEKIRELSKLKEEGILEEKEFKEKKKELLSKI